MAASEVAGTATDIDAAADIDTATQVPDRRVILDGDIVLLHCPDTSGVVYSKPFG